MKIRKIAALGIATSVLVAGVALAAPATAEPASPGLAMVGSDTLQDSLNALTNGTSTTGSQVRVSANGVSIGNFDAFGSKLIQTKPYGKLFTRPSGSGAGVTAIRRSITGAPYSASTGESVIISNQVDIARSSGGPGADATAEGQTPGLAYIPYGRDAVGYIYDPADAAAAAVLDSLTEAQLKSLYEAASVGAATTIGGIVIQPRLPQSNSGTRKYFLGAIGVTTVGSAVPAGDKVPTGPAENDASVLIGGAANEIIPFAVSSWIAQKNSIAPSTFSTGTESFGVGAIDGIAPTGGSIPNLTPGATFFASKFGRDTFLVVEYARVDDQSSKYDPILFKLLDHTQGNSSLTSFSTSLPSQVGSVKAKFGFIAPSTNDWQFGFTASTL